LSFISTAPELETERMMYLRLAANQRSTADPKIALNLAEHHSTLENIDVDDCVVVEILSSASLHALLVYEKGFDALGVRE
jgi:hypothetical protein